MYIITNKSKAEIICKFSTVKEAICYVDSWLSTVKGYSLLGELNDMQAQAGASIDAKEKKTVFDNKYEIPLYFINLVLGYHNLKICDRGGKTNE